METIIYVLAWIIFLAIVGGAILLYFTWKIPAAFIIQWMADHEIFFDSIPEGYATAYESGTKDDRKFVHLACSYKGFGPVKTPGDFDWAIRRIGDEDDWPEHTDKDGKQQPAGKHAYTAADFYPDRRPWFIKRIFGDETGIVYMGLWPQVKPKYYNLRINNFRTVKPSQEEAFQKNASIRDYKVGERGDEQIAGYLISWNVRTKRVLLSDDNYPFPADGVRIGTDIPKKAGEPKKQQQQAVLANVLPFIRGRVQEPYLYLYRVQNALEIIQNELIQIVRELCAGKSLVEVFGLRATLHSADIPENAILTKEGFGKHIRKLYGFEAKGASFAFISVLGKAADAFVAPYVARQEAEATATRGIGEGKAERSRLTFEGEGFQALVEKFGLEGAIALRSADVADKFATGPNNTNTVVLGFENLKGIIGGLAGRTNAQTKQPEGDGDGKDNQLEP